METNRRLAELLLALVPEDGSPIGNAALRDQFLGAAAAAGLNGNAAHFEQLKSGLVTVGALVKGKGRGGSVRRLLASELQGFALEAQEAQAQAAPAPKPGKPKAAAPSAPWAPAGEDTQILSYRHPEKRKNNPEVGMVTPATDPAEGKTRWQHDPHLDPALSWTGKAERLSSPWPKPRPCSRSPAKGRDGKSSSATSAPNWMKRNSMPSTARFPCPSRQGKIGRAQ